MEIEEIKDALFRILIFNGLDDVQRTLLAHTCHFKRLNSRQGECFLPAVTKLRDGERLSEVKLKCSGYRTLLWRIPPPRY